MNQPLAILTLLFSLFPTLLSAQTSNSIIYFQRNAYEVDILFEDNAHEIEKLFYFLEEIEGDSERQLSMIEISGSASPEGNVASNEAIVNQRLESIARNIQDHFNIPDHLISIVNLGIAWDDLFKLVANSNMEYRDEVVRILDNGLQDIWWEDREINSRNKQLVELGGGEPYEYMFYNFFPKLRKVTITLYYKSESPKSIEQVRRKATVVDMPPVKKEQRHQKGQEQQKYLLHLPNRINIKTNLLYLAALAPNIDLEYIFLSRNSRLLMSVEASLLMPWWSNKVKHQYYQLLFSEIEFKFYLGRKQRHHLGLNIQGGLYSLKFTEIGKMGDFVGYGLGYGYLLPVARNMSIDFKVGVGCTYTRYQEYYLDKNNDLSFSQREGEYKHKTLFVPSVGISLVWMIGVR